MISLHCHDLLYHCTFKEMKKLIEVICEQIEVLESNKLIPRKLDPSKKWPAWYRQNSVFIKIGSKVNFRYEIYDTSQFFGRCQSVPNASNRTFDTNFEEYEREVRDVGSRDFMQSIEHMITFIADHYRDETYYGPRNLVSVSNSYDADNNIPEMLKCVSLQIDSLWWWAF